MARFRWLVPTLFAIYCTLPSFDADSWWSSWLAFWADLGDEVDPATQAIRRSQERDHLDGFLVDRGGWSGDAAGTGGQE